MQHTMRLLHHQSARTTASNMVEVALDYARRGWPVVPLTSISTSGLCSCGSVNCQRPGMHLHPTRKIEEATVDATRIKRWWGRHPAVNVGIATGNGLLVMEIDARQGGSLEQLIELYALPETMQVQTEDHKWQLYFSYNPSFSILSSQEKLGTGVTIHAAHSYVVAPPCLHTGVHTKPSIALSEPVPLPTVLLPALLSQRSHPTNLSWKTGTDGESSPAARDLASILLRKPLFKSLPPRRDLNERSSLPVSRGRARKHLRLIPLDSLFDMEIPDKDWLIPDVLPYGVTLLTGKAQSGKTYLALEMALSVSAGSCIFGKQPLASGDVLFLGLGESMWSMHERTHRLLNGRSAPRNVSWAGYWEQLAHGGLADIEDWLEQHPAACLVVIDALEIVQPLHPKKIYGFMTPLTMLAERYNIAILLVHTAETVGDTSDLASRSGSAIIVRPNEDSESSMVHILGCDMKTLSYTYNWTE